MGKGIVKRANDGFRDHNHVFTALGHILPTVDERRAALAELAADTPAGRKRRADLQWAIANSAHEFHGLGIEMNQRYASVGSTAVYDADDAADMGSLSLEPENPDEVLYYTPSTRPGRRLPHVWLNTAVPGEPVTTIDLAGKGGFLLLTGIGGADAWRKAAAAATESLGGGVPVRVVSVGYGQDLEDVYGDWARVRDVEESGCVLVRPDRFVAWRCRELHGDEAWATKKLGEVLRAILSR